MRKVATLPRMLVIFMLLPGCSGAAAGGGYTVPRSPGLDPGSDVIVAGRGRVSTAAASLPEAPAAVWPVLLRVYGDLGFTNATSDAAGRTISVKGRPGSRIGGNRPSLVFDCGQAAMGTVADIYTLDMSISSQLIADPQGSRLVTSVSGTARSPTGSAAVINCSSTGKIEAQIADLVRERIP